MPERGFGMLAGQAPAGPKTPGRKRGRPTKQPQEQAPRPKKYAHLGLTLPATSGVAAPEY